MSYVTSNTIKELREKKKLTQKQLADILLVSDKTVSKWETGRGLPDIGIIEALAGALDVSLAELLAGEVSINGNRSANMRKSLMYVCPVCGNVIVSTGKGAFSCCGIKLPALEPELIAESSTDADLEHNIKVELLDNEYYVSIEHPMSKDHYISFILYATISNIQMTKLYPEQMAETRFSKRDHGYIYAYCNKHGLYRIQI